MKLHINKKLLPGSQSIYINGDNNGILLLHDLSSTPSEFLYFIDKKSRNYTISAPLIKGHGTSKSDLDKCSWQEWFTSAKNVLFEMRKKCERIIIIGQTFGALLALHLAAHYQVEGLILLSPGNFKAKNIPKIRITSKRSVSIMPEQKNEIQAIIVTYKSIPLNALQEYQKMFNHIIDDLTDIHTPVVVFNPSKDVILDDESSEYIYEKIPSKSKKQLTVNNSNHLLLSDVDRDIIVRESFKFIDKCVNKYADSQGA